MRQARQTSRRHVVVREARAITFDFYIYYIFWPILGVFFPLISNPLGARSYLLSILRKSKMAAIKRHILGNVLRTVLMSKNEWFWCLLFGFGGQRVQWIGFCWSIFSKTCTSKMAAIKSPCFRKCLINKYNNQELMFLMSPFQF